MSEQVDPTTYEITQRLNDLEEELNQWKEHVAILDDRLRQVELRLNQIGRPKMPAEEALKLYEMLQHNEPSLTLASFAKQHGLSYDTLRQARSRRSRKKP
jgi:chromosome segregation ATPase